MAELIDISLRLHPQMVAWPSSAGFNIDRTHSIADGSESNVSRIDMDVHCGTHVEAPLHFIEGGQPLEETPLDAFVGRAAVVHVPNATEIGPAELASAPEGIERLLLRTSNSDAWGLQSAFNADFVALTVEAAHWIADRNIRLVGIDSLSIQRWVDGPETHRILMRAGVAILEGIDLRGVVPGIYRLTCLPLALVGAEASPVRAILEPAR